MSVKFTYRDMNNPMLKRALKKLGEHYPYRDPKVRYSVEKLIRKWDQEAKTAQENLFKDIKGFAELDEKGEVKTDPKNPAGIMIKEDKQTDWGKHLDEFDKMEFTIEIEPFTREQLDAVALSPVEMIALENVLAPEVETPKAEETTATETEKEKVA